MKNIYTILALTCFVAFILKFILHAYIDSKNGYSVKLSPFLAFEYVLPYNKNIEPKFQKLKNICNILYRISITIFCLTLIALLIFNIQSPKAVRNR